jgi:tetratricopeptide (TPR) repeat protein
MVGKKYFVALMATALFLVSGLVVFAQTAPVRGTVMLKKPDGTEAPVSGAAVEVYRTDAKGKLPAAKTDKKGTFNFAGFPLGQVFALVITAPGVRTEVTPNIKGGMETVAITVYEGDGKPLTEDEVRAALTVKPKSGGEPTAADSEAAKKAKAEYDKQVAEVNAKNEKVKNVNEIVKKSLEDGRSAFEAKNYDLAITKFDEGINADPDFEGSAPVLLNNKAISLRLRAFDAYNLSKTDTANKDSLMEKAKNDFSASIATSQRSIEILKKVNTTDANLQKAYDANKYGAYANIVESFRLLIATKADQTRIKDAVDALVAYETVETVPAQRAKTELLLADVFRLSGNSAEALPIYRRVLEVTPENPDAIGGAGLSLFDVGVSNTNKEQMQEGLNLMQQFADNAPATHPLKTSVKEAVDYLKNTEKLTPQKITTPTTTKTTNSKKKP